MFISLNRFIISKLVAGSRFPVGSSAKIIFGSFNKAREFIRGQNINGVRGWRKYKSRPTNIPYKPNLIYKDKGWKGWKDFLGNE